MAQKGMMRMGVTNANKSINVDKIECGGTFTVTLSLTAEPDLMSNPTDIVLILDRSGSMTGTPLASLKNGAKKFVDIIAEATGGAQSGQIGFGSRIGIVSFSTTATQNTQMITSVSQLKTAIDGLTAGGRTNHADAFTKAAQLLTPHSGNARVLVMFTDGVTTAGTNPSPVAAGIRADGSIIYVIGLAGNGGVDEDALEDWASKPPEAYVTIAPTDQELEDLFENLARNLSKPGATDIVIEETLQDCFRIVSVSTPTKGAASVIDAQSLRWTIDKLGVSGSEGASLDFVVQHLGGCSGTVEVNSEITYDDKEGNHVEFPNPVLEVDCGSDVFPEPCPEPVSVHIDGCEDAIEFDAGDLHLESLGRILQLDVTLRNVCPHRRVALAVILSEVDEHGMEHKRGLKTVTVPAHTRAQCRDVTVRCIKFVLPEDLDVSGGSTEGICDRRNFKVRFIAHYIDHDFDCCQAVV